MFDVLRRYLTGFAAIIYCCYALLVSPNVMSNELNLSVSDESFRVNYSVDFQGNDISSDLDYFYNEDVEVGLLGAGIYVSGRSNASTGRQTAGIGTRLFHADLDGPNGSALSFGGFIKHRLSQANLLSVRASLFKAPGVTSFDRVEDYLEFTLSLEYQLLDSADLYLGYRDLEVDFGDGDVDLDETFILGLIMRF